VKRCALHLSGTQIHVSVLHPNILPGEEVQGSITLDKNPLTQLLHPKARSSATFASI